jgi:hypothetical protein
LPYTPKVWKDLPDQTTPITASELIRMETGIDTAIDHADTSGNPHSTTAIQVGAADLAHTHPDTSPGSTWRWASAALSTNPGAGKVGVDNNTVGSATLLYLSATDKAGTDYSGFASALKTKDVVFIWDRTNADNWARFEVSGTVVDNTSWLQIPVVPAAGQGAEPSNNSDVMVMFLYGPNSVGSALTVQDENSNVSSSVTQIDFQGSGVTTTSGSGEVIVTVPGLTVQDENGTVASGVTQIDFQGAGVTAAAGSGEVVVTITGAGGGAGIASVSDEGSLLTSAATSVNFVGSGVTTTNVGAAVTVTIPGATGANTVRSGSGVPSNGLGVDGDFYINTAANTIYGPKASGVWGSSTNLVGPQGATGTTGSAGVDGKTVRSGSGVPSNGLGVDGDFYINTAANTIYGPKASGVWGSSTSLVGPQGTTGANGQGVPTGGTTSQVLSKIDGTNYNTQWVTPSGGAANITVKDEGTTLTSSLAQIDFTGSGVTATTSGANVTVTIPGGAGGGNTITWLTTNVLPSPAGYIDGDVVVLQNAAAAAGNGFYKRVSAAWVLQAAGLQSMANTYIAPYLTANFASAASSTTSTASSFSIDAPSLPAGIFAGQYTKTGTWANSSGLYCSSGAGGIKFGCGLKASVTIILSVLGAGFNLGTSSNTSLTPTNGLSVSATGIITYSNDYFPTVKNMSAPMVAGDVLRLSYVSDMQTSIEHFDSNSALIQTAVGGLGSYAAAVGFGREFIGVNVPGSSTKFGYIGFEV